MSLSMIDLVWRRSQHKGSELLVLLAIADNANEQTGIARPSQELLAAKTRLSRRGVQKILPKLLAAGELVLVEKATSHASARYSIEANKVRRNEDVLVKFTANTSAQLRRTACSPGLEVRQEDREANASLSATIQEIYDHWRAARGKTRANYDTISDARRKKIKSRLREFSKDELLAAIDGVARDPWPDRALHDDLTVIFRSREQVEKFLEMPGQSAVAALSPLETAKSWLLNVGWQYPDGDLSEELARRGLEDVDKHRLMEMARRMQREAA